MPKIKVTNRILLGFLVKNRIKGKFMHNLHAQNKIEWCVNRYSGIVNDETSSRCIGVSFIWYRTPEGNKFWSDVDLKYKSYLKHYLKD